MQRANCAPNVGELFSPEDQEVQATAYDGDPCSHELVLAVGRECGVQPKPLSKHHRVVRAARGSCGRRRVLFSAADERLRERVADQGNPNLDSEVADTTTSGVVVSFDDREPSVDGYQSRSRSIIGSISYDIGSSVIRRRVAPSV